MPAHLEGVRNIESSNSPAKSTSAAGWWAPRLAGPVITAAVVRLALLATALARNGTGVLSQVDTVSYLEPGRNLLLHGRFVADGAPDLLRTPGYPLFLAVTSLAGLTAAALANVILSVISVILVWKLARSVFDDNRIALGAAWIFALEPISVAFSVVLMSEPLFIMLLLLCLERLSEFLRELRLRVLAVAGLWLAAATFVRPVTYYLPFALALGLFVVLARVSGLRRQRNGPVAETASLRWKAPAILLISVLPWLAAWQIRNWVETGYPGFSSIGEVNFYYYNISEVKARLEHRSYLDTLKVSGYTPFVNHSGQSYLLPPYLALHPEQAGWSQGQRLAFMRSESIRVIRANFGTYVRFCILTPLFKTIFSPGAGNFDPLLFPQNAALNTGIVDKGPLRLAFSLAKSHPWVAAEKAFFLAVLLGLYLFATRGLVLIAHGVFRDHMCSACLWLLLGSSLYFMAVSAVGGGPGSDARFRLPVMPVICILASAGFQRRKPVAA